MKIDMSQHLSMGKLLRFTLPTIGMMVLGSIYNIITGLFVSNFAGKLVFAAINLMIPYLIILGGFGFMIGIGGSAIVAKTLGEGNPGLANRRFSLMVYAAIILAFILMVIGVVFAPVFAQLVGAEGELLELGIRYARIVLYALPLLMMQNVLQSFFVAAGKPQLGFAVSAVGGCCTVLLNALFVVVMQMGIVGAALATALSQVVGGAISLIYFIRKNKSPLRLGRPSGDLHVLGKTCTNGSSEMVGSIAAALVSSLYNFQLLRFIGDDGVAAYGALMYMLMVFGSIFIGYSAGMAPLVSFQYGAKNPKEIRSILLKSTVFIGCVAVVMFSLCQICARPLASVFVGYDAELCALTIHALRIFAFSFLLMGFNVYGSSFFTALSNGVISAIISFARAFVCESGAVIVLPLIFGVDGIWFSNFIANVVAIIMTASFLIAYRKRYGYWKKCVVVDKKHNPEEDAEARELDNDGVPA